MSDLLFAFKLVRTELPEIWREPYSQVHEIIVGRILRVLLRKCDSHVLCSDFEWNIKKKNNFSPYPNIKVDECVYD